MAKILVVADIWDGGIPGTPVASRTTRHVLLQDVDVPRMPSIQMYATALKMQHNVVALHPLPESGHTLAWQR